jgi:hypothetical protein
MLRGIDTTMTLTPEIAGELELLRLGKLRGEQKALADEIIRGLPREYVALIGKETSILSLVRLSDTLNRQRKIDRKTLDKMGEFTMMCAGGSGKALAYEQTKAERREAMAGEQTVRGKFRGGSFGVETIRQVVAAADREMAVRTKRATTANRELTLLDYSGYAGNENELARLRHAAEVADKFFEMRSPTGKKDFKPNDARDLYRYLFPNKDEAEPWYAAIVTRLKEMLRLDSSKELQKKYGDSRFHAITAVSKGNVVGYTQFSTMPLEGGNVVVFWQYGGVADKNFMKKRYGRQENFREEGIGSAYYVFRHGIAAQDAEKMGYKNGVAGTILEAEFIGQADNESDMRFTKTRLHIHRQMGAKAIMLEMEDGSLVTAHMQPRLSLTSNPILLHMCFRPLRFNEEEGRKTTVMDKDLARSLVMSYIDNFDREGFDKKDVQEAREILQDRFAKAKRILLVPPENLPNICELARMDPLLKKQVENDYGSVEAQEARIKKALAETAPAARRLGS